MYIYIHIYIDIYIHIYIFICSYIYIYIYLYMYLFIHVYTHIRIHIHNVYIFLHIYVYVFRISKLSPQMYFPPILIQINRLTNHCDPEQPFPKLCKNTALVRFGTDVRICTRLKICVLYM